MALQDARSGAIASQRGRNSEGRTATKVSLADYARYAEPAIRLVGYANCTLMACAVYTHLVECLPANVQVDICEVRGIDHVLVVMGRDPDSDPTDMSTWGPNAVVCDAWANQCYPLSRYREMQRPEHNVKRLVGETNDHHLGGPLQVVDGYPYLD